MVVSIFHPNMIKWIRKAITCAMKRLISGPLVRLLLVLIMPRFLFAHDALIGSNTRYLLVIKGNVLFSLLTGLFPYYNETNKSKIKDLVLQGPPYIDPRYHTRSLVEGRMVEIMDRCHSINPEHRADIFEVVRYLRETKELNDQEQQNEGEQYTKSRSNEAIKASY